MRKQLSIVAVVSFALLLGLISCNKEGGDGSASLDDKTGKLTVNFSLPEVPTRAATIPVSTAKPLTTWANITRAMILFVNPGDGLIKDTRVVTLPASGTATVQNIYLNVVANTGGYDTYIVGNYPADWNLAGMKGTAVSSLKINAPGATGYAASSHLDAGTSGYDEVGDIFVAKQTGVIVNADQNNTAPAAFKLTRINSLFRVRLDVNTHKVDTKNDLISFTAATTMFSVRRAATGYALTGTNTYSILPTGTTTAVGTYSWANGTATTKHLNVFYKNAPMLSANPAAATHSNPTTILTSSAGVYDMTLWNEYRVFPGSYPAVVGADKFDIVISALTTDSSYVPSGSSSPVSVGTRIYWSGQVQQTMGPNQILELSIVLTGSGGTTLPPLGSYGNLTIDVDLVQWGDIISGNMEL